MTVNNYKNEIRMAADHFELKKIGQKMYADEVLKSSDPDHMVVISAYRKRRARLDKEYVKASTKMEFRNQLFYINTMSKHDNRKVAVARVGKTLHGMVNKGIFSRTEADILFRAFKYQKYKIFGDGKNSEQMQLAA